MGNTNLDNLVLKDAETAATGRGDITAELALIKADLTALAALANDVKAKYNAAVTLINEIKADFNAHTHNADGAQAGSYFTSPPRSDAATVTLGTASSVATADSAATAVVDAAVTTK